MNIIDEIFFAYQEGIKIETNAYALSGELEDKLSERLDAKGRELLNALIDAKASVEYEIEHESFKHGFIQGCRFMLEIINDN